MNTSDKLSVENVDGINYIQKREDKNEKISLSDDFLPKVETEGSKTSKTDSAISSIEITTSITEKIDSIKSCESTLKIFTFEPKEFNKRNQKCLEFWNLIDSYPEIKPVNCVIMDAQSNKRDKYTQTEQKESEESLWMRALGVLMEKKVHKAAMNTSLNNCKFCVSPKDSYDVSESDNLSELDCFNPPCLSIFGKSNLEAKISSESLINQKNKFTKENKQKFKENEIKNETQQSNTIVQEIFKNNLITTSESNNITTNQEEKSDNLDSTEDEITDDGISGGSSYHTTIKNISQCFETVKEEELNEELVQNLSQAARKLSTYKKDGQNDHKISCEGLSKDGVMESWKKPSVGGLKTNKKVSLAKLEIKGELEDEKGTLNESKKMLNELKDPFEGIKKDKEVKNAPEESKKRFRDGYNYPQHVLSLLKIDVNEYKNAKADDRKILLQGALKENYKRLIKKDPEGPKTPPCPCTQTLQEKTRSFCNCKPGICNIPKDLEVEDLKELEKYTPYYPGLDCIKLMLEGLKKIRNENLPIEETSNEVRNLLKTIQSRSIENPPCECPLHRIDLDIIEEKLQDKKFIKDMVFKHFEETLDEKYTKKLGVKCSKGVKNKKIQLDEYNDGKKDKNKKLINICIICGKENCKCNLN